MKLNLVERGRRGIEVFDPMSRSLGSAPGNKEAASASLEQCIFYFLVCLLSSKRNGDIAFSDADVTGGAEGEVS